MSIQMKHCQGNFTWFTFVTYKNHNDRPVFKSGALFRFVANFECHI